MDRKRTNYISWDDYFMGVAFLAAKRSKDPSSQVGAVIVDEDNKIVGVGEFVCSSRQYSCDCIVVIYPQFEEDHRV